MRAFRAQGEFYRLYSARMDRLSPLDYPCPTPPDAGEAVALAPGVEWLRMPLPFALDHINLWRIEDGDGHAVVDCGLGDDATRTLWQRVLADRAARHITRVFVTHHHPDHSGNAGWLVESSGVELWMSQGEFLTAHALREEKAGYAFDNYLALFRRNGLGEEYIERLQPRRGAYRRSVPVLPQTYRRLLDGAEIAIGARRWRVITGYGHAPEHASLYCDELRVLIAGDMVLPKISTNVAVWPVEPNGDPLALFLASLARYRALPADTLVLPSHGLPFRGLHERIAQLEAHHEARLAELYEACEKPRAAAEVLEILFRRTLDEHQIFFAMGEAMAHLHYLHHRGRLERLVGENGVVRYRQRAS